jgi:hypothetical protein
MADSAGALAQALAFGPKGSKDKLVKGYARTQQPTLDIPVQTFAIWDSVQLVQGALTDLENGTSPAASILCDATGRDDRILATLSRASTACSPCRSSSSPGSRTTRRPKVAEELEACWATMFPESELSKLLRWGRFVGACPGEIVWSTPGTRRAASGGRRR